MVSADRTAERRPEHDLLGVMSLIGQSRRIERYLRQAGKALLGHVGHIATDADLQNAACSAAHSNVEAAHVVTRGGQGAGQQGGVARCALKTMVAGIGYTVMPANRQLRSTAVLVRPLHARAPLQGCHLAVERTRVSAWQLPSW